MREIVLDTETTGVFPDHPEAALRDRVVEIGCVELFNLERTGRELHLYLNPERDVPDEVVAVHGLRADFLRDKPKFAEIVGQLMEFIGDAPVVAHNAGFDANFINAELKRCGREALAEARFVDTLTIARNRFRGASCSLDALAKRFQLDRYGFDLTARKADGGHGALIDARILAEVYLQLKGGREQTLVFEAETAVGSATESRAIVYAPRRPRPTPLPSRVSEAEAAAHETFIDKLGLNALWRRLAS